MEAYVTNTYIYQRRRAPDLQATKIAMIKIKDYFLSHNEIIRPSFFSDFQIITPCSQNHLSKIFLFCQEKNR